MEILTNFEKRLKDYETFENAILIHIEYNYFPFVFQSLYNQLDYEKLESHKFTNHAFKNLLKKNNFLDLINEIYRTRLSKKGSEIILKRLEDTNFNFDVYENALKAFENCNTKEYKNGTTINASALSLGTKILHFYNPEENPILDSFVRTNLDVGDMTYNLCVQFQKAANDFVKKHADYFEKFYESESIKIELEKRHMTHYFPKMEIVDMALYESMN